MTMSLDTAELQTLFKQAKEVGDATTMVKASMAIAKRHGLIVEKRVVVYPNPEAAHRRAATRELGRRLQLKVA